MVDIGLADGAEPYWYHQKERIESELSRIEDESARREDFTPAISRKDALNAVGGIYSLFACRPSETAAAYALVSVLNALGISDYGNTLHTLADDPAMVERVARALCREGGFDPDEMMPNDGPRWRYYVPAAQAALRAVGGGE